MTEEEVNVVSNNRLFMRNMRDNILKSSTVAKLFLTDSVLNDVESGMRAAFKNEYLSRRANFDMIRLQDTTGTMSPQFDPETGEIRLPMRASSTPVTPTSIVHELLHSANRDNPIFEGDKFYETNRMSFEEPATELLALQITGSDGSQRAYQKETQALSQLVYFASGGDSKKALRMLQKIHQGGSVTQDVLDLYQKAYNLSDDQMASFAVNLTAHEFQNGRPSYSNPYNVAEELAFENTFGDHSKDERYARLAGKDFIPWILSGKDPGVKPIQFVRPTSAYSNASKVVEIASEDIPVEKKASKLVDLIEEEAKKLWDRLLKDQKSP
jgi:hypothetical protein